MLTNQWLNSKLEEAVSYCR